MGTYTRHHPGEIRGKLTLIERMPGGQKWRCKCVCGNEVITQISGGSMSCRRCAYERLGEERTIHGKANTTNRLYRIWLSMRTRCNNPRHHSYKEYGARGIKVAEEWDSFVSFEKWSMDNGYNDSLSIERMNNDGMYTPDNCKWIKHQEQMKNTRHNHYVTINGISKCVIDWCKYLKIQKTNAYCRARKKDITVDEYLAHIYDKRHEMLEKESD